MGRSCVCSTTSHGSRSRRQPACQESPRARARRHRRSRRQAAGCRSGSTGVGRSGSCARARPRRTPRRRQAGHRWIAFLEGRLQADVGDLDDDFYLATVFNRDGTCARRRFPERDFHDGLHWLETAPWRETRRALVSRAFRATCSLSPAAPAGGGRFVRRQCEAGAATRGPRPGSVHRVGQRQRRLCGSASREVLEKYQVEPPLLEWTARLAGDVRRQYRTLIASLASNRRGGSTV